MNTNNAPIYVTGPQVRHRYNVTDMTIWRWRRDPRLGFPDPIVIQNRNYWLESDLMAWERSRPSQLAQNHPATRAEGGEAA